MEFEYTNAELDFILERFDKTGPKLQRQIVAQLMSENAMDAGKNSLFDEMRGRLSVLQDDWNDFLRQHRAEYPERVDGAF